MYITTECKKIFLNQAEKIIFVLGVPKMFLEGVKLKLNCWIFFILVFATKSCEMSRVFRYGLVVYFLGKGKNHRGGRTATLPIERGVPCYFPCSQYYSNRLMSDADP